MKRLCRYNLDKENNGNGVYKIYNKSKKLVYVGRANNGKIKHHLVQHFGSDSYSGAKFANRKDYYYQFDRKANPKTMEKILIKKIKPKKNKYLYIKGKSRRK